MPSGRAVFLGDCARGGWQGGFSAYLIISKFIYIYIGCYPGIFIPRVIFAAC